MWPWYSVEFRPRGDLAFVIAATVEARNALHEGQFPIRVAPRQLDGVRHPIFQYYGNFPYTVTGWLSRRGISPNTAWCALAMASMVAGAYFTYRLASWYTRRQGPSILAGLVFLAAPYIFINLNARGALTEFVAMNLLPEAFYITLRAYASRRPRYIPLCALSWALIGLTHNAVYVFGILFVALALLLWPGKLRRMPRRIWRLAAAGVAQAVLLAWYFVPQLATLRMLDIHDVIWNPFEFANLTPLRVLLSPMLTTTPASSTAPGLGLQVGWPILAAAILSAAGLALGRGSRLTRRATGVALILFLLAVFMVWSPFDFWRMLPRLLWFVQFPYRLLMFVVIWGAVLTACGLSMAWQRNTRSAALVMILIALGACVFVYYPRPVPLWPGYIRQVMKRPEFVRPVIDAYLLSYPSVAPTSWVPEEPYAADWAVATADLKDHVVRPRPGREVPLVIANKAKVKRGKTVRYALTTDRPIVLELPVLYYPGLLEVRDNGRPIRYGNAASFLAVELPPGPHRLAIRFVGTHWANILSTVGWIGLGGFILLSTLARLLKLVRIASDRGTGFQPVREDAQRPPAGSA